MNYNYHYYGQDETVNKLNNFVLNDNDNDNDNENVNVIFIVNEKHKIFNFAH